MGLTWVILEQENEKDMKKEQEEKNEKQKRIPEEQASTNVGTFELVDGTKVH